jgi:hypothetical protein
MKKLFFMLVCITMVIATAACYAEDGCRNRDIGIGVKGGYGMPAQMTTPRTASKREPKAGVWATSF